jgi:hypothetical protein
MAEMQWRGQLWGLVEVMKEESMSVNQVEQKYELVVDEGR